MQHFRLSAPGHDCGLGRRAASMSNLGGSKRPSGHPKYGISIKSQHTQWPTSHLSLQSTSAMEKHRLSSSNTLQRPWVLWFSLFRFPESRHDAHISRQTAKQMSCIRDGNVSSRLTLCKPRSVAIDEDCNLTPPHFTLHQDYHCARSRSGMASWRISSNELGRCEFSKNILQVRTAGPSIFQIYIPKCHPIAILLCTSSSLKLLTFLLCFLQLISPQDVWSVKIFGAMALALATTPTHMFRIAMNLFKCQLWDLNRRPQMKSRFQGADALLEYFGAGSSRHFLCVWCWHCSEASLSICLVVNLSSAFFWLCLSLSLYIPVNLSPCCLCLALSVSTSGCLCLWLLILPYLPHVRLSSVLCLSGLSAYVSLSLSRMCHRTTTT